MLLSKAICQNELSIHYQPQVDMKTGAVIGFEALLRWNNKMNGLIPPDVFIPIAEKTGLINSIGDWVMDQVLAQQRAWMNKGFLPLRISINISPLQLQSKGFVEKVKKRIHYYQLKPELIELEITENVSMDRSTTLQALWELKRFGVMLSIDDFGTGYSSLSYLKDLPFDILKIDRTFVKDIEVDEKNIAIISTIIDLALTLGMTVIAEGVEKTEQAAILLKSKCRVAQGFLYSPALPSTAVEDMYLNI